jgi:hypothetical protein
MVSVDPEMGSSLLRLWVAAGSAALLVVVCLLAFMRPRTDAASALKRSGVVAIGAILGAALAWSFLDRTMVRDHDADRRALEMRAEELTARSLAPGSSLTCLDALAGDTVEAACEKALFATPANVATATSYAAARLALLSDMTAYVKRGGAGIDNTLLPLRRSVEADRFGFLAHALAVRDGCTSVDCKALAVLSDESHVRINLSATTFDRYLDRYVTVWAQPDAVADATANQPAAAPQAGGMGPHKVVNIDFPTAASIPAVSIMNPEPAGKAVPGAAAAAAANPNPPPAAANPTPSAAATAPAAPPAGRKPRKQAANPPPPAPSPPAADAAVDPVWTPAPLAAPPQPAAAAAPAANVAAGAAAPMQLTPAASPQ